MGPRQYATRLFNAEVNLASDWVIEQKQQLVKHKRYIRRSRRRIMFLYKEDDDFDLAGNVVQVRDDISQKNYYQTESLDGACFLALSAYIGVDMMNPTYSGVVMGVSKEKNVTMLFSKVSTRRCQKMNKIIWAKAMKTLDLAQSVAYTIARCKKTPGYRLHLCMIWLP
jgi:hypothetical protein